MFLHQSTCISPQHTFPGIDLEELALSADNQMRLIEPKYQGIPLNILRRMGKAVRIGVGAALPLLKEYPSLNGIIIGSANGGMEDCIKFLNQIMQYKEGTLTPTNFVQSTANAIAAQIALTSHNNNYNITHVHRGLAFENAMLDVIMLLKENSDAAFLLGGLDEISDYNFNIEKLGGWYKNKITSSIDLYNDDTPGSIAGEGVAMFVASNKEENALAKIIALKTLHTSNQEEVKQELKLLLENHLNPNQQIDLLISGENGDNRLNHFYQTIEEYMTDIPVTRFKHLCGEYPTSTSFALWLATFILQNHQLPPHLFKTSAIEKPIKTILIYNNYKGLQHSFILVEKIS